MHDSIQYLSMHSQFLKRSPENRPSLQQVSIQDTEHTRMDGSTKCRRECRPKVHPGMVNASIENLNKVGMFGPIPNGMTVHLDRFL